MKVSSENVYVGETCRHFCARVREHKARNKNSHIYRHLISFNSCKKVSSENVYVGETCRHFCARVREHKARNKNSHIYKHLISSNSCKSETCFTILGTAKNSYHLEIKEVLHINWLKPTLNSQDTHACLTLDMYTLFVLCFIVLPHLIFYSHCYFIPRSYQ